MDGLVISWFALCPSFPEEQTVTQAGGFFRDVVPETKVGNWEEWGMEGGSVCNLLFSCCHRRKLELLPPEDSLGNFARSIAMVSEPHSVTGPRTPLTGPRTPLTGQELPQGLLTSSACPVMVEWAPGVAKSLGAEASRTESKITCSIWDKLLWGCTWSWQCSEPYAFA